MGYGTPQQSMTASAGKAPLSKRAELFKQIKKHRYHYLFVLPMLVFFAAFTLWPMIASWYYSFFNWDGIGWPTDFVGLGNFREVASDPGFWNAFMNTFLFALTHVLIQMPLALIVAVILNNQFLAGRNVYRLLLFVPVISTTAVIGVIFSILLNPLGGAINEMLLGTGLINEPINFLGSTALALPTLLAVSVWKSFGTPMIYWLAGLQTIPGELYEAAKIDGASKVQSFFRITVPMLAPIGLVITLLTFINNLDPFDLVRTMTEGGPVKATDVVQTYIFRYAFEPESGSSRYGFASAAGILFSLAVLVVVIIQALTGKAARKSGTKGA
ncbi:sugar ABC transporter permease [Paenibacillus sp. DMB5]|uniref:carbohydrate ABC transporter permease n=1 Tax=Paenibacillus sp. DMB5 TaxID=1780103 RepID=UPI000AC923B9|nr:sugar ABC transporter permease [Paenibacillus sp. DMB5]